MRSEEINRKKDKDIFTIGNLRAGRGERVNGVLELAQGRFSLPAAVIHGEKPGKTILITAGIHGGEYVGIQAAMELSMRLNPKKTAGTIVIIKIVNLLAFEARKGSMGLSDNKNLNRVFPGKEDGTEMERLAWAMNQEVFPYVDYYIDLHSGDDYEQLTPYVYYAGKADPEVVNTAREMARQADVPYMVKSNVAVGGSYNCAASAGIPSILLERGGMGRWSAEEVQSTVVDVKNVLYYLGQYEGKRGYRNHYPLDVSNVCYQSASYGGCWYPCKTPGDIIHAGELLGHIRDYDGEILEVCRAEFDGVILFQTESLQVLKEGPLIAYGQIAKIADDRKERIVNYWKKRSDSFLRQRREELKSPMAEKWMKEIRPYLPEGGPVKILDVGCGAGFFSILLAKEGHHVTGTDLTPEMIEYAALLAAEEGASCSFRVMDAENIEYGDKTFDVVISRNLTWTLPNAEQAYSEWKRVLKPGGILLNFDANYGLGSFVEKSDLPENHAHFTVGDDLLTECEEIKRQLPISSYNRPAWDLFMLGKLGLERFLVDLGISSRLYEKKDAFYNPMPMFMICAKRGNV